MLEMEAKARVEDLGRVREKLMAMGAEFRGEERQEDLYFSHPVRDFAWTDEALRLRLAGGRSTMTYKGPKLEAVTKTREELEVGVDDHEGAVAILERLGFRKVAMVVKRRELYGLEGYRIMLDEVEGLGTFVEVEKATPPYQPEELVALLKRLGAAEGAMERRSYLELLLRA